MAFNYSPKIITDGLVLYLDAANTRSYPGSGTVWSDLSRGGNNGTLTNGPTFDAGNGGSIVFDGVNDFVSVNSSSTIPIGSNARTLSIWFYTVASTWVGDVNNLFQYGGATTRSSLGIDFHISYPQMQLWTYGDDMVFNSTFSQIGWKNITVTYNGNVTILIYENGIFTQTKTLSGVLNTSSTPLYIGSANPAIISTYYLGNIANVQIYNRALSATEILQNYNATKTRFGL
jgi:hypothetical protein